MANIETSQSVGMAGHFTIKKFNSDSGEQVGEWDFDNLITNGGLDRIGTHDDWFEYCYVGSGQKVPAFTDNTLQNPIASNRNTSNPSYGNSGVSPYYLWLKKSFQFGGGEAAGNIAEVGIGWSGGSLFSRALILDELGDPTVITVLSNEFLTVDYELRIYPKLTDDTGSVTFTGSKGGTYDWIFRSARANAEDWGRYPFARPYFGYAWYEYVSASDIGSVTSAPSGLTSISPVSSVSSYVPGSYECTFTRSLSINEANFTTGLRSFYFTRGIGQFQIQFDPAVPKENTDTLSFTYTIKWGRI